LTFGHSGAQDWAPECPNVKTIIKMLGQTSMLLNALVDSFCHNQKESVGLKGLSEKLID